MKQNWEIWMYQKGGKLLSCFPKLKKLHEKLSSLIKKECQKNNISLRFKDEDDRNMVLPDKEIRQLTIIMYIAAVFFILLAIKQLMSSLNISTTFLCCIVSFVLYAAGVMNSDKFEDILISEKLTTSAEFPISETQKTIKKQKKKNFITSVIGIVFFLGTTYLGMFRPDLIYRFLSEHNLVDYIPKKLQKDPIIFGLFFVFFAHIIYSVTIRVIGLLFRLFTQRNIREL